MQTNYKKLSWFETLIISWLFVGLIIVIMILFTGLSFRMQSSISIALQIFDLHEEAIEARDNLMFVLNIPDEFNKQFYLAFTQIAVLPPETFEVPTDIVRGISAAVSESVDALSLAVVEGYQNNSTFTKSVAISAQPSAEGKIMGAMIQASDRLSNIVVIENNHAATLEIPYSYTASNLSLLYQRSKIENKNK
jgi:hypothetical protein